MTRDEAIEIERKKLMKVMSGPVGHIAVANIDALIELGLLKVDEPYKPIFVCGITGKLSIDIRYSSFNVTTIVEKNGDTISLNQYGVAELKEAINKWETYRGEDD